MFGFWSLFHSNIQFQACSPKCTWKASIDSFNGFLLFSFDTTLITQYHKILKRRPNFNVSVSCLCNDHRWIDVIDQKTWNLLHRISNQTPHTKIMGLLSKNSFREFDILKLSMCARKRLEKLSYKHYLIEAQAVDHKYLKHLNLDKPIDIEANIVGEWKRYDNSHCWKRANWNQKVCQRWPLSTECCHLYYSLCKVSWSPLLYWKFIEIWIFHSITNEQGETGS